MLEIVAAGMRFVARWEEELAPKTVAAFKASLPLDDRIIHCRWSGESNWIPWGDRDFGIRQGFADLAATDATLLTSTFGPTTGLWILLLAKGGGDTNVSAEAWLPRSRSHVITFPRDLSDRTEIDSAIIELAHNTLTEIVEQGRVAIRVAVTVRTNTFYTRTKIRKLEQPTTDADAITQTALELLGQFELDRPIRLLGVRLELAPPEGGY